MKPLINQKSLPWLVGIDEYVRQGTGYRGSAFLQVASDVLDGWATRRELYDLIRRRVLEVVPCSEPIAARGREICGNYFTVHLTERAARAFWPDRMATA